MKESRIIENRRSLMDRERGLDSARNLDGITNKKDKNSSKNRLLTILACIRNIFLY